jgi:hypothetical protein
MVVSARNAAATVRNTWHAFTRAIAHSARSIRLSLFPVPERKQRTPQPNPRFTANWWVQIAFDIFEDPVAAVQQHSEPAPIADPLPAVPPPPVESSKQRRSRRPRPVVPAFVLNSFAAVHRACHICIRAGGNYAWTVYYSFVRDCRFFFRGLTPPTPALETASSSGRANTKPSADRNVFAPVVNWLRQPFPLRNGSSNRSAARSSRRS